MYIGGLILPEVTVKWVGKRVDKETGKEYDEFDVESLGRDGRPRQQTISGNGVKAGSKINVKVGLNIGVNKAGQVYCFMRKEAD